MAIQTKELKQDSSIQKKTNVVYKLRKSYQNAAQAWKAGTIHLLSISYSTGVTCEEGNVRILTNVDEGYSPTFPACLANGCLEAILLSQPLEC